MGDNLSRSESREINRCTLCSRPKDDKRDGPCCICIADTKRAQESERTQRGPDSHQSKGVLTQGQMEALAPFVKRSNATLGVYGDRLRGLT